MDLTLHRRRPRRHVPAPVPALAALGAASVLSAGLLLLLSDVVARLG